MVRNKSFNKLTNVIHDLMIHVKIMTVNNAPYKEMYDFIDEIEYLPQLIVSKEDQTELFDNELIRICEKYNLPNILNKYNDLSE
ncbi:hypothetical protein [Chryseobacterium sp.]|uniref:hypothetical protein n=1 Tax=Chryseobacterium sp. TaxID=1871047 RepID=UPI0028984947|nr:hypothetical protein [Chryseobacterium sp.]